jgi:hypothetical protein
MSHFEALHIPASSRPAKPPHGNGQQLVPQLSQPQPLPPQTQLIDTSSTAPVGAPAATQEMRLQIERLENENKRIKLEHRAHLAEKERDEHGKTINMLKEKLAEQESAYAALSSDIEKREHSARVVKNSLVDATRKLQATADTIKCYTSFAQCYVLGRNVLEYCGREAAEIQLIGADAGILAQIITNPQNALSWNGILDQLLEGRREGEDIYGSDGDRGGE